MPAGNYSEDQSQITSGSPDPTLSSTSQMTQSVPVNVVVSIVICLLIILTVLGNILVIAAVLVVRKLRQQPSNYLLISLAASDLCVGSFIMPFAWMQYLQGEWTLGTILCDIWTSADVFLCSASILSLCAISVDRYFAIIRPLSYGPKRTTRRIFVYIAAVWLVAFFISAVPVFAFTTKKIDNLDCQVNQTLGYQIYATMGAFYIPAICMIFVNFKIFRAAKKIVLSEKRSAPRLDTGKSISFSLGDPDLTVQNNLLSNKHSSNVTTTAKTSTTPNNNNNNEARARNRWSWFCPACSNMKSMKVIRKISLQKLRSRNATDNKAAKTLSIIMGAFIVCWLPFFVFALVKPICTKQCIPAWLDNMALWLGYVNSTLNPMLYAVFNRDFRIPFREILCCRCCTLQNVLRQEIYAEIYGDVGASAPPTTVIKEPRIIEPVDPNAQRESLVTNVTTVRPSIVSIGANTGLVQTAV